MDDEVEKLMIEELLRDEEEIEVQNNNGETTITLFVAENYPIESAIWYWCKNNDRIVVDGRRSINECIEMYSEHKNLEQFLIATQLTVNGCIFSGDVLGRIYNPENKVYITNGKAYIEYGEEGANDAGEEHFCAQPNNWEERLRIFKCFMYYITGDELSNY